MPSAVVDGNDPLAVRDAVATAAEHARSGSGPYLIECKTVRWERHSAFSSGKYANPEEAMRWKTVDPLPRFAAWLQEAGVQDQSVADAVERARQRVDEAVAYALDSPSPAPESVYDGMFAE